MDSRDFEYSNPTLLASNWPGSSNREDKAVPAKKEEKEREGEGGRDSGQIAMAAG